MLDELEFGMKEGWTTWVELMGAQDRGEIRVDLTREPLDPSRIRLDIVDLTVPAEETK